MIPHVLQPAATRLPRARRIAARLRGAEISLGRFTTEQTTEPLQVGLPAQDAFYMIMQLRDQPPHEFGVAGRTRMTPPAPRGGLQIVDLRGEPRGLLRKPFDSLNLLIPQQALAEIAEGVGASRISALAVPEPWQTRDAAIDRLAPALISALADETGPLLCDQLVLALATHLAESYGGLARPTARSGGLAPWQERRARELIAANLGRGLSLMAVAEECRLSPWHFSRAFKASTGLTPHGWLQQCRIERARELLRGSHHSIAAISLMTGFSDQSHLSRVFRRATGTSPNAWRRRHAGGPLLGTSD